MQTSASLKDFLEITYETLEELNLQAKAKQLKHADPKTLEQEYRAYLQEERRIKAVTLCFSDIEGRFHMLDYDKKYLLKSADNLTFDGSSIRGFSSLDKSDLRLGLDWSSFMHLPADIFGPGKVIFFASVLHADLMPHASDFRTQLKLFTDELRQDKLAVFAAAEVEGFLVEGIDAEQQYDESTCFTPISSGGYYHSLPLDRLRTFIDKAAEAQRAMGFENEKDHPEVAPSQFELNFSYTDVVRACDQIQLYKLVCRQVAQSLGMTATFLPKPVAGINGSGMHINLSLAKQGRNAFYDKTGDVGLSPMAWDCISRILNHAPELCLVLNSSVNAYRRLDPHFEAPNQIKVSDRDRGSMIRIPMANERTARIEVRSVAPDANPYLALYTLLKTGLAGRPLKKDENKRDRLRFLPDTIHDALKLFKASELMTTILGDEAKEKYAVLKQEAADRSPKLLGGKVKRCEVIYHHEITNQLLWNDF